MCLYMHGHHMLKSLAQQPSPTGSFQRRTATDATCADEQRTQAGLLSVHAFGHWLGLLHTAHAASDHSACNANSPGDYVADTPAQALMNTLPCVV